MHKFGHQCKYGKFRNYAIKCNHASSLDSADVINDSADVINESTDYKSADSADSAIQCRSR